jgi:hypothetical protein
VLEQLLLGDEPIAMLDQIDQDIEHARFESNRLALQTEFTDPGIEFIALKDVHHSPVPLRTCRLPSMSCSESSQP